MSKIFHFEDPPAGLKGTSGWWKDLERGVKKLKKKLVPVDALNNFWAAGRSGLDALAQASGIPLSSLRQQYRTTGIDPDSVDTRLTGIINQSDSVQDLTAADWEFAIDTSESQSWMSGSVLAIIGVVVAGILVFGVSRARKRG